MKIPIPIPLSIVEGPRAIPTRELGRLLELARAVAGVLERNASRCLDDDEDRARVLEELVTVLVDDARSRSARRARRRRLIEEATRVEAR